MIAVNSIVLVLETGAGYWITQHNPETYHYLIDTGFIALAILVGVVINFLLLRASFAPLTRALEVVQAVDRGDLAARVPTTSSDPDAQALASAFNQMLDQLEQARDDVARQVMAAHEAERRRVALELHDQIGQSLTALTLHAQALTRGLNGKTDGPKLTAQAARLEHLAQRTLGEIQALAHDLRPSLLDDLGLVAALRALATDAHERLGIKTSLDLYDLRLGASIESNPESNAVSIAESSDDDLASLAAERFSPDIETALFRIAQESLTNAVRHGSAHHMRLRLRATAHALSLVAADDGCGFDPAAVEPVKGLGIIGMRERAHLIGGALRMRARPGVGCVLWARVPLPESPPDHVSVRSESLKYAPVVDDSAASDPHAAGGAESDAP
ncbi:MAG TPA: sensor histidine kinase [Ktedonobacterales bacterium]|jgi:two-component system sensor histidine kinase UhpB